MDSHPDLGLWLGARGVGVRMKGSQSLSQRGCLPLLAVVAAPPVSRKSKQCLHLCAWRLSSQNHRMLLCLRVGQARRK